MADGIEIASDGTVPFRTGERIAFSYLISTKFVGDECSMRVLREGQTLDVRLRWGPGRKGRGAGSEGEVSA